MKEDICPVVSSENMGGSTLTQGERIAAKVTVGERVINVTVAADLYELRTAEFEVFSGGLGPIPFARHHALEDLSMTSPEPDCENQKNLVVRDCVNPEDDKERSDAGVLKRIKAAAERGLSKWFWHPANSAF